MYAPIATLVALMSRLGHSSRAKQEAKSITLAAGAITKAEVQHSGAVLQAPLKQDAITNSSPLSQVA